MTIAHEPAASPGGDRGHLMTPDLLAQAARLVDEITARAERDARLAVAAWTSGYRAGFTQGEEIGHARAERELAEQWRAAAAKVRSLGTPGSLTYAEFTARRIQPGGKAYLAARERRGGRDYTGGPVPWDTTDGEQSAA